jgi:putative hydroxymethylpyrimidine transport system permease protein
VYYSAALFLTFSQSLSRWLMPVFIISQAMPTFAMAPLLVIWLGYGFKTKIVATILMLFFPITSAFYDGLRQTNQDWLDLAQIMQASPWRVLWYIRLPAALPKLASGMRIAAAAAPMGAIISEWVGASCGLGYLMLNANAHMQIDLVFAILFVIIFLSLALYFAIDQLTQTWVWW